MNIVDIVLYIVFSLAACIIIFAIGLLIYYIINSKKQAKLENDLYHFSLSKLHLELNDFKKEFKKEITVNFKAKDFYTDNFFEFCFRKVIEIKINLVPTFSYTFIEDSKFTAAQEVLIELGKENNLSEDYFKKVSNFYKIRSTYEFNRSLKEN